MGGLLDGQLIRLVVFAGILQGRDVAQDFVDFLVVRRLGFGQRIAQRGGGRLKAARVFVVE